VIVALVLAAGSGSRFSTQENKLLQPYRGLPLLRCAIDAALASRAEKTIVVTGFDAGRVEAAMTGLPVQIVRSQDHAEGMAASLRAGLRHASDADGLMILLGDMPQVSPNLIDRLIETFGSGEAAAVIPIRDGQRGNPVLLGRALFPQIAQLSGDTGARALLRARGDVIEVETDEAGVILDIDTASDFAALKAR
jgi:molybdenum cofactor cytidylyltransferase